MHNIKSAVRVSLFFVIAGRHLGVVTWAWPSLLRISEVKGRNTCYRGEGRESPLQTVILLPGEFPYRLKTFQEKSRTRFVLTKKKKV